MSASLTTTMPYMRVVIDALISEGLRKDIVVLVGGAPLNEAFAEDIGWMPIAGMRRSWWKRPRSLCRSEKGLRFRPFFNTNVNIPPRNRRRYVFFVEKFSGLQIRAVVTISIVCFP